MPNAYGRRVSNSGALEGEPLAIGPLSGQKWYAWAAYNAAVGEYLLVWEDYRNGDGDIYGQRLSEDGEATGDNFQISTSSEGEQLKPKVAAAGETGYLILWEDRSPDSEGDIIGQRVSISGTLLGENFAIAAESGMQAYPAVSWNSDAELYLAVWREGQNDEHGDIAGQLISGEGVLSGSHFIISAYPSRGQAQPDVAAREGDYLVVWQQWQGSDNYDIYGQQVSGAGELLDNPGTPADERDEAVSFAVSAAALDQKYPRVAVEEAGGSYLVVWREA